MIKTLAPLAALLLTACVTTESITQTHKYEPIGGSKADGRIIMAFFYDDNSLYQHEVDDHAALDEAARRCRNWGYNGGVEGFAAMEQVSHYSEWGIPVMKVTREFQCLSD